ncbi:hypothetical protein D3C87_1834300 [compost metagenome]
MGEEAFGGGADLSGMQETGLDDAVDGLVQVHVAQESCRVFAAQFQGRAGQPGAHGAAADRNTGGH